MKQGALLCNFMRFSGRANVRSGVIRVGLAACLRLPLYSYKQTSLPCVGMSQMGQSTKPKFLLKNSARP
jgi:hypothetical protein